MIKIAAKKKGDLAPTKYMLTKTNVANGAPVAFTTIGNNIIVLNATELAELISSIEDEQENINTFLQKGVGVGFSLKTKG